MPARRAITRWAWRLFRREWRQQVLVLSLLTLAVAAATLTGAVAYATTGPEGTFGTAKHRIWFDSPDPSDTERVLAVAEDHFGTIDVIRSQFARIPGSIQTLELRSQNPDGPYSSPLIALLEGRFPTREGEVAVTDSTARLLGVGIGESFDIEQERGRVVGLVENPNDLDDEFALVSRSSAWPPQEVTILVAGEAENLDDFRTRVRDVDQLLMETRPNDKLVSVLITYIFISIAMLLVALIAAAGFIVLAQRRMRHLGMLASVGATGRQLRLVSLANGAIVGVVAAALGTGLGLLAWALVADGVEEAAGRRVDGLGIPLWLIGMTVLLAIVTASGAAWWPGRSVARIPIMFALSSRAPRPKAVHHSTLLAAGLIALGLLAFELSNQTNFWLGIAGALMIPLGVLFISPLAIRVLARLAPLLSVAGRLALRDLARHQARSGAALASITLALGIAVSVVVAANAGEHDASEGNLSDTQMLIRLGGEEAFVLPPRTPVELQSLGARVEDFAARLDEPVVVELDMVVDPEMPPEPGLGNPGDQQAVFLLRKLDESQFHSYEMYIATPQLIATLGDDPSSISSHDVLTPRPGIYLLPAEIGRPTRVDNVGRLDVPEFSSLPSTLINPEVARRSGWESIRGGWFIQAEQPLTDDDIGAAREMAAAAGLTIETRDEQASLGTMRAGATGAGGLLALGILAMTVGLIRAEAAADLRTLTATGATSRIRRAITATTAGALALMGAALGIAGAYVALAAGDLAGLDKVPVVHLVVIGAGVPLIAGACGWLLAGREPNFVLRRAIE